MNRRNRRLRTPLLLASRWWSSSAPTLALDLTDALAAPRVARASNERFSDPRASRSRADDVVIVAIDDKTLRRRSTAVAVPAQATTRRSSGTSPRPAPRSSPMTSSSPSRRRPPQRRRQAHRGGPRPAAGRDGHDRGDPHGKTRIFGGAGSGGLHYSRAIPANSNYASTSTGASATWRSRSTALQTFPLAAARAAARRTAEHPVGQQRLDRLQGRHAEPAHRLSFSDVYSGQVPGLGGPRQGGGGRRHAPIAARPAPDLDVRQRPDAGPGDPGERRGHRARGLPAEGRAGLARHRAARLPRRRWRRSSRCACGSSSALGLGILALAAFLVGAQVAFETTAW